MRLALFARIPHRPGPKGQATLGSTPNFPAEGGENLLRSRLPKGKCCVLFSTISIRRSPLIRRVLWTNDLQQHFPG